MANFNPALVSVYDVISDALHPEDLVHINAVVVKTKNPVLGINTFNDIVAQTEHGVGLNDTTYKLFFTDKTFIYVDLGNPNSIYDFKEGPLDLLTGQKLTHFQFIANNTTFRMPKKGFNGITDEFEMKYLKYFLSGITIDKIDRLINESGGDEQEIIDFFNNNDLSLVNTVDTPSGLKINFVNDGGVFKNFVTIAHT